MYPILTVLFCTPIRLRNHHRDVTAAQQFIVWLIIMSCLAILVTNYLTASVTILALKRPLEAQPAQPAQDEGAGAGGGQVHQEDQLGDEYPHALNPFN